MKAIGHSAEVYYGVRSSRVGSWMNAYRHAAIFEPAVTNRWRAVRTPERARSTRGAFDSISRAE
jgi:hypothetical protein